MVLSTGDNIGHGSPACYSEALCPPLSALCPLSQPLLTSDPFYGDQIKSLTHIADDSTTPSLLP